MALLESYSWPGNARELENLIKVIISTADEEKITAGHLNRYLKSSSKPFSLLTQALAEGWGEKQLIDTYRNIVFEESGKDIKKASEALGRRYSTVNRWLKKQNASD
jgi:transcriptional regulator with PAS, ATPase and Fis domain